MRREFELCSRDWRISDSQGAEFDQEMGCKKQLTDHKTGACERGPIRDENHWPESRKARYFNAKSMVLVLKLLET